MPIEKQLIVQETYQQGVTVSYIARKHGIPHSQLFYWRKMMEVGALTSIKSEEAVVPMSEVNELKKRIKRLEQALGQKSLDNERLKDMATRVMRYNEQADEELIPRIRELTDRRASYGYRRITILLNCMLKKEGKNAVNHKRVYRIMKKHNLILRPEPKFFSFQF